MPTLTLLSYNIKAGRYHSEGLEAVARVIEALSPDIVTLQEVDRGVRRTGKVDQPAWLSQRLGMQAVFGQAFRMYGGGDYGNALLSRWPITRQAVFLLPKPPRKSWQARWLWALDIQDLPTPVWNALKRGPALRWLRWLNPHFAAEPRCVLATIIQSPWGALPIMATHWGLGIAERFAQAQAMGSIITSWAPSGPLILAGDFNAQPDSPEISIMREHLVDVAHVLGLHGEARITFPSGPMGSRTDDGWSGAIDYIFVRQVEPLTIRVVFDETRASDHQPLLAQLGV